jgi:hypothetical protein
MKTNRIVMRIGRRPIDCDSSVQPFFCKGVHILVMFLLAFIYVYCCPTRFSYQIIIVSFKSNTKTAVTKMLVDTCIRTRKIIKCSVLIDSYLHHVYFHAINYFTKRQSTLPFRGIYVVGIETVICIYGKLLFPKQYVHPFFGEPENNLLSLEE